jgi:hypothetical protein
LTAWISWTGLKSSVPGFWTGNRDCFGETDMTEGSHTLGVCQDAFGYQFGPCEKCHIASS